MARTPTGSHSHARARNTHGAQQCLPKRRAYVVNVFLACLVLLAISTLLSIQFSSPKNQFHSTDISAFLFELDEQISDAGENASQMQLRLLRLAAGVEPDRPDRASRVFSELLSSVASLGHTLPCPAADAVQGPTNSTGCANGCFFAANLHNSVEVLPNMILQLLAVLGSLGGGEHAQRCFVSVYESGSTDATPQWLEVLRKTLDVLGVPNRIVTGGDITRLEHNRKLQRRLRNQQGRRWLPWGADPRDVGGDERIRFLASLRNAVLHPLLELQPQAAAGMRGGGGEAGGGDGGDEGDFGGGGSGFGTGAGAGARPWPMERIIFINDVFFCAADVRRLLRYDSADLACGMDFVPAALWLLKQPERERLMADHLAGSWGVSPGWAEWLSRSWLPFKIWKKVYGKSRATGPWSFPVFYDMWVARDVSGSRIRNREPYSQEPWTADRLAQGLPTPVYCCWNGLVNLRSEAFLRGPPPSMATAALSTAGGAGGFDDDDYESDRLEAEADAAAATRRARPLPLRFRSHRPGECAASECSLLCDDLHAAGYHRVLLEPNVRVSYDWSVALNLYGNLDLRAPENAPGLRYRPSAMGDPRQVEVNWDDDWLPRVEAGARSVECCGIQPGRQTADFDHGCAPRDLTSSWWSGEPQDMNV